MTAPHAHDQLAATMAALDVRLPLRLDDSCIGTVVDADARVVFTVDVNSERADEQVAAIVKLLLAVVNHAGETPPLACSSIAGQPPAAVRTPSPPARTAAGASHTPGPWYSYEQDFPHEVLICTLRSAANYDSPVDEQIAWTPKNPFVAGSVSHDQWKAQSRANARVIATAPEMFAELDCRIGDLVMLRRAIEEGDPRNELLVRIDDMLRETRAVVAKVVGH